MNRKPKTPTPNAPGPEDPGHHGRPAAGHAGRPEDRPAVKLVREAFGVSQRELAKRAGVTNASISLIE